jgi:F-type H+-transporting ATPase subunit a
MTGFLRSTTADLSTVIVWAVMVSVIIWYNNIKNNGFVGWLKGFTEPVVVMTPMNIISEIAQPVSMAFRHFGNVAGGGVITSILYTALAGLSSAIINLVASSVVMPFVVLAAGAVLLFFGMRKNKKVMWIAGVACGILGLLGVLQYTGLVKDVPVFQFGIPAVLSIYFDLFSGFVQALVFSLLSMVYISGSCPEPETSAAE